MVKKIQTLLKLLLSFKLYTIYTLISQSLPRILILNNKSANSVKLILNDYGHRYSFNKHDSLGNGKYPWMTYCFLDYIKNLDLSEKNVFEWGSGNSTIFWSQITKNVVSVENNEEWYMKIKNIISNNASLLLRNTPDEFINAINEYENNYDIIVLDGYGFRFECANQALKKLNKGGMIVLDDSDNIGYNKISEYLKSQGLKQIDFIGLKPMSDFIVSTSIFITPDFNFSNKYPLVQPKIFVGKQRDYYA